MSSKEASAKRIPDALCVHGPDGQVGTLHNTDPLSFSYSGSFKIWEVAVEPNGLCHLPW